MIVLDMEARSLREVLDHTRAEMDREFKAVTKLYAAIERHCARIKALEDRACTLGDEICRRALAPRAAGPWPFTDHRSQAEVGEDGQSLV